LSAARNSWQNARWEWKCVCHICGGIASTQNNLRTGFIWTSFILRTTNPKKSEMLEDQEDAGKTPSETE
jgi:hypothetical protein